MKVVLYARVSTTDKEQDPETQLLKLRAFAAARGYQVIGECGDHASGADPNRPGLAALMADARRHAFDAIIVVRLDRIMRSTRNLLNMLEELQAWGVDLICVDQPIETNTAIGKLLLTLLGAVAEFERELVRERVRDGMARAKAQGKHVGRSFGARDKKQRKTRSDKGGGKRHPSLISQPVENMSPSESPSNKELFVSETK